MRVATIRLFAWLLVLALVAIALLCGCREQPTPTPPAPTPRPSPTPSLYDSLEESRFTISLDDQLVAYEQLHVGEADGQPVVFSELRYLDGSAATARRSVLLSPALNPVRYELEYVAWGRYSTYVAERQGEDTVACLANNLDWYGPVLVSDLSPAPQVMLEAGPSALPFALLALRYDALVADGGAEPGMTALDVTEAMPASRPFTVTVAAARQRAVIGTTAFEARLQGSEGPAWTFWVRPGSRALYGAEMAAFKPGFWQARQHPTWPDQGRLVIQRVSQLPQEEAATIAPVGGSGESMTLAGGDGRQLAGTLMLPTGSGPFPCLVLHSREGLAPRWPADEALVAAGWAVFSYDKRGLGQSEGTFDRDRPQVLAEDAVAVAKALAADGRLDADRLVFVGYGEAGRAGVAVAAAESNYAAAILASWAWPEPAIPSLAQARVRGPLAAYYGWSPEQIAAYEENSLDVWQQWLFDENDEVTLLGRRIALEALKQQADLNPVTYLAQARIPVLVLHSASDAWTPVAGIEALRQALGAQDGGLVRFEVLPEALQTRQGDVSAAARAAMLAWLDETLK
jgi:pimeloyl-ACP methyl ester carboxylesterase